MYDFESLKKRMIAIDTEYQSISSPDGYTDIERDTFIHKVFCAAFCTYDGRSWVKWVTEDSCPDILDEAAKRLGISDPLFVNFFYNAEWTAFKRLGVDITHYSWLDTWLLYRLKVNVQGADWEKFKSSQELVSALKDILNISRDSEHKEAIRQLCITDNTEGYEEDIMAYCLEDVRDLIPLAEALWTRLEARMKSNKTIIFAPQFRGHKEDMPSFEAQIFGLMESLKAFTAISHRGIPVSIERLEAVRRGAAKFCDELARKFVERYPGSFTFKPIESATKTVTKYVPEAVRTAPYQSLGEMLSAFQESIKGKSKRTQATVTKQAEQIWELTKIKGISGTWHRNDTACRDYLQKCLTERGVRQWKKTTTGQLSLDSESLKDEFDHESGCFGADYYTLSKATNCLKGVQQEGEKSWIQSLDREDSLLRYEYLRPFAARTGRCQPQASRGFVPAWYKALYCVLEPPEGKWLVELDFSSEETFIQAMVFSDKRYDELYHSKDLYLWMGVELGLIPKSDFDALPLHELKKRYKKQRDMLKTYTLALGYGAGAQKLASKVKLPLPVVKGMQYTTQTQIFPRSTQIREYLKGQMATGRKRCLWLQTGWHTVLPLDTQKLSMNAPLNFPIQAMGAAILHSLVVELEKKGIHTFATIHDAVFFMVDEGDYDSIKAVSETMVSVANQVLGVPEGNRGIKVGEPEIVRHGEIWTPEHAFDEEARKIIQYGL